jgi:murein DD-endopeptidase MepM/ murein hydrolase activator NlpD
MHKIQPIIFLLIIVTTIGTKVYSQFNTVLPPKEEIKVQPQLASNEVRAEKQEAEMPVINDALAKKRKELYKTRQYLSLPIDSVQVTSDYGMRKHPIDEKTKEHKGVDLRANNDYVYSVMPGMIMKTGNNKKLGNFVEIEHGDFKTIYGHLQTILVNIKQSVEAGQPIAISGNSGESTGEHLHFGMKYNNVYIDPQPVLKYIYDLINFVKTDLSKQIDTELRKN